MRHAGSALLAGLSICTLLAVAPLLEPSVHATEAPVAPPAPALQPLALELPVSPAFSTTIQRLSSSYFLHVPADAVRYEPLQVVVVMHGMGGSGMGMCRGGLIGAADANHWILLAPNFSYGDWRNPAVVSDEDLRLAAQVKDAANLVASETKLHVRDKLLLFGFSRGAQLAHRTALFYPEAVRGVATFSAGTYTLPDSRGPRADPLPLPYGVGDLALRLGHPLDLRALDAVPFLVGVGASDVKATDLPRQWDPYLGTNRVQRAAAFEQALERAGVPATFATFPGGHEFTLAMRDAAVRFFKDITLGANGANAGGQPTATAV